MTIQTEMGGNPTNPGNHNPNNVHWFDWVGHHLISDSILPTHHPPTPTAHKGGHAGITRREKVTQDSRKAAPRSREADFTA